MIELNSLKTITFYNMKSIDFGYSMKITPQPRKESCIYNLIDKTKQLLKHMR